MRQLENLQRIEWTAAKEAGVLSEKIRKAISEGAAVEDGPLYYDGELEMVRTRKARLKKARAG